MATELSLLTEKSCITPKINSHIPKLEHINKIITAVIELQQGGVMKEYMMQTGITATAGGGQAGAYQLTADINDVSTIATANDSVKLPELTTMTPGTGAGYQVCVKNNGANNLAVFPYSGDSIAGLGVDTAMILPPESFKIFRSTSATQWETEEAISIGDLEEMIANNGMTIKPLSVRTADGKFLTYNMDANCTAMTTGFAINYVDMDFVSAGLQGSGDYYRSFWSDIDEVVTHADGSEICSFYSNITPITADRADVIGFKSVFDGTKDTAADLVVDFYAKPTLTLNGAAYSGIIIDGTAYTHTSGSFYGEQILLTRTNLPNPQFGIFVQKNTALTTAAAANAAVTNYGARFEMKSLNVDDGGFDITNAINDVEIYYSCENSATTAATADTLTGNALNIAVAGSVIDNANSVITQLAGRLINAEYTLTRGAAGTINQYPVSLIKLDINVPAGVTFTSAGQFNGMLIDADRFVPGATASADTRVVGYRADFSSSDLGADISFIELTGVRADMPGNYATNGAGIGGGGFTAGAYFTGNGNTLSLLSNETPGTDGIGINLNTNTTAVDNPAYGIIHTKTLLNNAALGAPVAVTNNSLYLLQEVNTTVAGTQAVAASNIIGRISLVGTTSAATLDLYTGTVLSLGVAVETVNLGRAVVNETGLLINYDITETFGTLTQQSTNVAYIDYDTAGTVTIANLAVRNLFYINGTDAGVVDYGAGASSLSGLNIDLSGINVASANLTLYGINVVMPASSVSGQYGLFINAKNSTNSTGAYIYALNGANVDSATKGLVVDKYVMLSATPAANKTNSNYATRFNLANTNSCTDGSDMLCTANGLEIIYSDTNTATVAVTADTMTGNAINMNITGSVSNNANSIISDWRVNAFKVTYALSNAGIGAITTNAFNVIGIDYDTTGAIAFTAGNYNFFAIDADDVVAPTYGDAVHMSGYKADFQGLDATDGTFYLYGVNIIMPRSTTGAAQQRGVFVTAYTNNCSNTQTPIYINHDEWGTNGTHSGNTLDIQCLLNAAAANIITKTGQFININFDGTTAARDMYHGTQILFDINNQLTIDAPTVMWSTNVNSNHDDLAADGLRGYQINWVGNIPGAQASSLYLIHADFSGTLGSAGAAATLYGVFSDVSGTMTAGTYAAGRFTDGTNILTLANGTTGARLTSNIVNAANANVNINAEKTLTGAITADRISSGNNVQVRVDSTNTSAGDFDMTTQGNVMVIGLSHVANETTGAKTHPDSCTARGLYMDIDGATTNAIDKLNMSSTGILVDYSLTETSGTLSITDTYFSGVIRVEYNTAGSPDYAAGNYSFYSVVAVDAGTPTYAATSYLSGYRADLSAIKVSNVNLVLYGINVVMPATYGNSVEYAAYFTGDSRTLGLLTDTAHMTSAETIITDMPVTAPGSGFDIANGVKYVPYGKRGATGMIVTEIYVDLQAAAVTSKNTVNDIIGEAAGGAAYIGQITAANNGTVVAIEVVCLEAPATGDADIDFYSALENTGAYDADVTGLTEVALITAGASWTNGMVKGATALPAGASDYLYLASGNGGVAGAYSAGIFIIRIYGV